MLLFEVLPIPHFLPYNLQQLVNHYFFSNYVLAQYAFINMFIQIYVQQHFPTSIWQNLSLIQLLSFYRLHSAFNFPSHFFILLHHILSLSSPHRNPNHRLINLLLCPNHLIFIKFSNQQQIFLFLLINRLLSFFVLSSGQSFLQFAVLFLCDIFYHLVLLLVFQICGLDLTAQIFHVVLHFVHQFELDIYFLFFLVRVVAIVVIQSFFLEIWSKGLRLRMNRHLISLSDPQRISQIFHNKLLLNINNSIQQSLYLSSGQHKLYLLQKISAQLLLLLIYNFHTTCIKGDQLVDQFYGEEFVMEELLQFEDVADFWDCQA